MSKKDKYVGTTVHTGWFPLLTSTKPQKAFSKGKSARGVSAKGYSQAFIKHVQAVVDKRGKDKTLALLNEEKITKGWKQAEKVAESEYGVGFDTEDYRGSLFERKHRAARWSDVRMKPKKGEDGELQYDDASRLEDGMKKFQLRGNFVWYNKPKGGPKALAQAIINNNFNFKAAEKWYQGGFARAGGNMSRWASETLGMGNKELITPKEVEQVGKMVGETVLKDGQLEKIEGYDKSVTANPRDIKYKGGPAEISEMRLNDKHGYPKVSTQIENDALKTVLDNHASNVWNKTVDAVIESEKQTMKAEGIKDSKITTKAAGARAIGKNSHELIKQAGVGVTVDTMNKLKHEMADYIKGFGAKKAKSEWTDILRRDTITDKNTGMKDYHRIELSMDNKFHITINKVTTIRGIEAGQALLSSYKSISLETSLDHSLEQQIGFAHNFGKNTQLTRTHNNMTMQTLNNLGRAAIPKTEVSFSPKVAKDYVNNIIDRFGEIIVTKLAGAEKRVQDAVSKKAVKYNKYGGIFWAAPYIGIEEGINIR